VMKSVLPSDVKTVVLDWDGTLAYSCPWETCLRRGFVPTLEPIRVDRNGSAGLTGLFLRPGITEFLERLSERYVVGLWSFGVQEYVMQCLRSADLLGMFKTVKTRAGMETPFKDLFIVSQRLSNVILVDDECQLFGFLNPDNCVQVTAWRPFENQGNLLAHHQMLGSVLTEISVRFSAIEGREVDLQRVRQQRLELLMGVLDMDVGGSLYANRGYINAPFEI